MPSVAKVMDGRAPPSVPSSIVSTTQSLSVRVATCTPLAPHPMDDLSGMLGAEIDPVLAPRIEITTLLGRAYRHKADGVDEALDEVAEDGNIGALADQIDESEDVLDVANKAPIIKLVNTILFQALKMRASDVHFHPYQDRMQVRIRIDGILYDMDPPSAACRRTAARRSAWATARSTCASARSPRPTASAS